MVCYDKLEIEYYVGSNYDFNNFKIKYCTRISFKFHRQRNTSFLNIGKQTCSDTFLVQL